MESVIAVLLAGIGDELCMLSRCRVVANEVRPRFGNGGVAGQARLIVIGGAQRRDETNGTMTIDVCGTR